MRRVTVSLVFGFALALGVVAHAGEAADGLLRLVPSDAALTLVVEDLRDHAREFFASPLAGELGRLPAVRSWFNSERFDGFVQAKRQIERLLGGDAATLRDELLGDAVVLALHVPPRGRQSDSRGLLLLRPRDRAVLDRLIDGVNAAQKKRGELLEVEARARAGQPYWVRRFAPGSKRPTEFYTVLGDNTFAWSNSEPLVQRVIDRNGAGGDGLGNDAAFRRVRRALPARPVVSLYANPRFLSGLVSTSPRSSPSKPGEEKVVALLGQYLAAVEYLGAAVEWRGTTEAAGAGIILHTEESVDPERCPAWLKRWAAGRPMQPRLERVPATALAVASVHVDFNALEAIVRSVALGSGEKRLDNLEALFNGLLLGHDFSAEVLPGLGPGVLAYLEPPGPRLAPGRFALVAEVDLGREPGIEPAVANALRTALAAYALDEKHGNGGLTLQTLPLGDAVVTALAPTTPFAFATHQGWLVLSRSARAVARAVAPDRTAARDFERLRAGYFPEAVSFLCVDLKALHRFADRHRAALAVRIAARKGATRDNARRDLDQALALIGLFSDGFLTSVLAPDARSVHRKLGLITRGPETAPRP